MKIITLTLNPAFDIHCHAESFSLYCESVADITDRDAGGKGINISRALCGMNVPEVSYIVLGTDNGEDFKIQLKKYGINFKVLETEGRIRENITVHTDGNPETRLSFRGFVASDSLIDNLEEKILNEITDDTYLTFTGSVPHGVSRKRILAFLENLKAKGVKLVIDSKSVIKEDLIRIKPWLIKPNEEEILAYTGYDVKSIGDCILGAKELNAYGIENVMITLGKKGAVMATDKNTYIASAPDVEAISTVGAGDSSIGGFLYAKYKGADAKECLKTAVAFGSAACMTRGTNPPSEKNIEKIISEINMKILKSR